MYHPLFRARLVRLSLSALSEINCYGFRQVTRLTREKRYGHRDHALFRQMLSINTWQKLPFSPGVSCHYVSLPLETIKLMIKQAIKERLHSKGSLDPSGK